MSPNNERKQLIQAKLKQQIKQSKGWYFITFVKNLPNYRPYGFTLYDEPFVLTRNKAGELACYLLPLQVKFNNIENTCVKLFPVVENQGMIWFWRKSEEANVNLIPILNNLDELLEDDIKMVYP